MELSFVIGGQARCEDKQVVWVLCTFNIQMKNTCVNFSHVALSEEEARTGVLTRKNLMCQLLQDINKLWD